MRQAMCQKKGKGSEITAETNHEINNNDRSNETSEEEPAKDLQDRTIGYKSEGYWYSKMVVTYSLHGKENKQEVSGNFGMRDIMKYDRFIET